MFRVGAVLGRSISILSRNAVVFYTLALLFTWPTIFITDGSETNRESSGLLVDDRIAGFGDLGFGVGGSFVIIIALALGALALYLLASCTMVYGSIQALQNDRAGIGACIRHGLPAVPRVMGIAILSALAIGLVCGVVSIPGILILMAGGSTFGSIWIFVAIVIPSLMIYSAWWVTVPVAVVERAGVVASLKRSAHLTRGYRWRVFGILLVIALLNGVVEWFALLPFDPGEIPHTVVTFAVTAAFTAWGAVAMAVAYHDLRLDKEGVGVNEIAAVFD